MTLTRVRLLLVSHADPFELGVAAEVFGIDRRSTGGPAFDFAVVTEHPGRVSTRLGFDVVVDRGLAEAADAEVLLVGPFAPGSPASDAVLAVIRDAHARGAWLVGLCTGAFLIARAGLLDGLRATTHWMHAAALAKEFPTVTVDPDVLYVQEGRIITSAGTAAGIDACLHLVRTEHGAASAANVARRMVVPPHRDGGQAQYIEAPLRECSSESFAAVLEWANANPAADLSVDALARRALTSPRTFARRFRDETGTTPAAWVARTRLTIAQRLLETSDDGVEEIARAVGFGDAAVLRQHFGRVLGTSPTAYRQAFVGR